MRAELGGQERTTMGKKKGEWRLLGGYGNGGAVYQGRMEGLWKWGEGGGFCVFVWFFWFALPRPKRGEGGGLFFFFLREEGLRL
jgi:hypothetical protein